MGVLEDKGRARQFYRYLSLVYDRINPLVWTESMREEALDMLDLEPDHDVLDVGCGTGFGTAGLLGRVERVHGLDQSTHQLERAIAKFGGTGRVSFTRGDAERLPYRSDTFDVVWSSGSIEYWPDPVAALRECRRVLRPGGQVLVVGPRRPDNRVLANVADAIMRFYDEGEADELFAAAGFERVDHRLMGPSYSPSIAITSIGRVPRN